MLSEEFYLAGVHANKTTGQGENRNKMTDLATGYNIRAYVINDNSEVDYLCIDCAYYEDEIRENKRKPYLVLIEEYEDSINFVKDFTCSSCGEKQNA